MKNRQYRWHQKSKDSRQMEQKRNKTKKNNKKNVSKDSNNNWCLLCNEVIRMKMGCNVCANIYLDAECCLDWIKRSHKINVFDEIIVYLSATIQSVVWIQLNAYHSQQICAGWKPKFNSINKFQFQYQCQCQIASSSKRNEICSNRLRKLPTNLF